jgi:hypothetical protein
MLGIQVVRIVVELVDYPCEEVFSIRRFNHLQEMFLEGPLKGETFGETVFAFRKIGCVGDEYF